MSSPDLPKILSAERVPGHKSEVRIRKIIESLHQRYQAVYNASREPGYYDNVETVLKNLQQIYPGDHVLNTVEEEIEIGVNIDHITVITVARLP